LLAAKSSVVVHVTFLPTATGLQAIRGAVCVDTRSGFEFPQDEPLAHVLVHAPFPTNAEADP
jgi:hypothetical protein